MILVGGGGSNGIDAKLARLLGARHIKIDMVEFPDGEYKVRMKGNVEGEDVLIVQSTYHPQDKRIFELLLIADLLQDMGARKIGAVVPYLAFARQNKSFERGESASIKTILSLFNSVGISYLVTVQPHRKGALGSFKGRVVVVEPIATLIDKMKGAVSRPFVLAPDKGGIGLARTAAKALHCRYTYVDKERDKVTGAVTIKNAPKADLNGKDVVIVDDVISTGGTIVQSSKFAYSRGARKVMAAAIHLVMAGDAYNRLKDAGVKKIFGANTIPYKNAVLVDISGDIAKAVRKSYNGLQ